MSGGSHNYICYSIENELVGEMKDAELNALMEDIVKLTHDLEWADSGDTDEDTYFKTVKEFKNKWFKTERTERLETIINEKCEALKTELLRMI